MNASGRFTCCNEGSNELCIWTSNSGNDDRTDTSLLNINQDIDQSNECNGVASCSNKANNEANAGGSGSGDRDGTFLNLDQNIDQSNICGDEADCSNVGSNEANFWEDSSSDKTGIDIGQSIQQSNECDWRSQL